MSDTQGVSLLEFLIGLAITALVGATLIGLTNNSSQIHQAQQEITDLEQNTAVVVSLLQNDLKLAGYRGGESSDFSGSWSPTAQAQALRWLARSENWMGFRYGNASVDTVGGKFRDGSLAYATSDELELHRVLRIGQPTNTRLCLERIHYDLTDFSLRRSRNLLLSSSQDLAVNLSSTLAFSLNNNNCAGASGGLATPQPVAEGVEDFQVFFLSPDGWSASLPEAKNLKAVGVYLRTRSTNPKGPADCAWPKVGVLPAAATDLGILNQTYTGQDCQYRRLERVLTLSLDNPQAYTL